MGADTHGRDRKRVDGGREAETFAVLQRAQGTPAMDADLPRRLLGSEQDPRR
ncbi:hypothetical protein ACH4NT_14410 [Streptomyces lydicus]|uniref:hypothetical protein n=1 Tax=Streptomyces lydicus TaxID=47763 RepID=UPI003790EE7A